LLTTIKMFRLNTKHLEIWFQDESRWARQPQSPFGLAESGD